MKKVKVSDLIKALEKHLEEDDDLPVRLMVMNDADYGATFTAPLIIPEEGLLVMEEDYSKTFKASVVLECDDTGQSEEADVGYKLSKGYSLT